MMKISTLILGHMRTNCYIIIDSDSNEAAVVDPADSGMQIYIKLKQMNLNCKYIILTHAHFDHMLGLGELRKLTGAPLCIHEADATALCDPEKTYMLQFGGKNDVFDAPEIMLRDNDTLKLGENNIKIMHTPGHTMGSVCLFWGNNIISGDTLFKDDIGRYDLYGADYAQLMRSLLQLSELEGD